MENVDFQEFEDEIEGDDENEENLWELQYERHFNYAWFLEPRLSAWLEVRGPLGAEFPYCPLCDRRFVNKVDNLRKRGNRLHVDLEPRECKESLLPDLAKNLKF